jgi:hypothetical protein
LAAAAQALDALQVVGAGVQQAGQAAKAVQQLLRQRQHALARNAGAQDQRQQLGVAQGGWPRAQAAFRAAARRQEGL